MEKSDKELDEIMKRKMRRYMEILNKKKTLTEDIESKKEEDIFMKVKPLFTDDGYNHLKKNYKD